MAEYDQKMTRAQMAEHAGDFMLPYTADSMRTPLRELGIEPLERTGVPGTKTSQIAYYDPTVLWALALAYHRPKSWPSRTPELKRLLGEYYVRAQDINFIHYGGVGFSPHEPFDHLWHRVSYWRLLVDAEHGVDLRLLDRIVRSFRNSVAFDMSGLGVLESLLSAYKERVVASLGHRLGGADGVPYDDAWELLEEVLEERGLVAATVDEGGECSEVINQVVRLGY